jgi:hypothetical protein
VNQTDEDARRHLMLAMRYTLDVLDSLSNALREITRETLEEPVVHRRPSPTPYRSDNATKGRSFLGRHRPREASTLDLFRRQP